MSNNEKAIDLLEDELERVELAKAQLQAKIERLDRKTWRLHEKIGKLGGTSEEDR